ncbi:MAG TPA: GGDEF domain-containing protein [Solirubrobacteraceae bacterium]
MDRFLRAQATDGRAQMARAATLLFGVASVVNLLGVVLPHQAGVDVGGYIAVSLAAAVCSLVFLVGGARLPGAVFHAACAAGIVLVSLGLFFNGERHGGRAGGDEIYYAWVVLFVAYFMGRRATAVHGALACAAYAGTLAAMHIGPIAVSRWITITGMITGASIVVRLLRARADGLLASLRDAALTDHLTGLCNRRAFEAAAGRELARSHRGGGPVSLVMMDIDAFKAVNDRLGHAAGDDLLVDVARVLCEQVRAVDVAARLGGDEFAVLLPGTDHGDAKAVAARIADAVRASSATGISYGVAELGGDVLDLDALLRAADGRLYDMKRAVSA